MTQRRRGAEEHKRLWMFWAALGTMLLVSRLCHVGILWEGDAYPLAAAGQMLTGKALYRDIWFDKPPLTAAVYLLCGAKAGWGLRVAGAIYALGACCIAWAFARRMWGEWEGLWAAGLLGFYLTFDLPSAVIPVASDLLMLAPHLAAVWMAHEKRPFWSGVLAGVAFWINPKGAIVAVASVLWYPAGVGWIAAGFAAVSGVAVASLYVTGSLSAYWEQVWVWGRLYAGSTFVQSPLREGLLRTLNWAGFHSAAVVATGGGAVLWGWIGLAMAGVAMGLRFFPRYYFLLLAPVVMAAARGRRILCAALLLAIPLVRFAPSYWAAAMDREWRDTAMDRDSRAVAAVVRASARPGDTLFVWGYRPELYPYTGLKAGTRFLDSQPLTGVPADRHLTLSEPLEMEPAARRRMELAQSHPTFVLDGLGSYNPRLAITSYPELRAWLEEYRETARVGQTVIYRRLLP